MKVLDVCVFVWLVLVGGSWGDHINQSDPVRDIISTFFETLLLYLNINLR